MTTEPPLSKDFSEDTLKELKKRKLIIPNYPCHSQAVERAIKLVSSVCLNNIGNFNIGNLLIVR